LSATEKRNLESNDCNLVSVFLCNDAIEIIASCKGYLELTSGFLRTSIEQIQSNTHNDNIDLQILQVIPKGGVKMKTSKVLFLILLFLVSCMPIQSDIHEPVSETQQVKTSTPVEFSSTWTAQPTKKQFPTASPTNEPTQTPIPTDIPTPIPIDPTRYENWWTYVHPTYGFSFRLPNDWVVTETTTGNPMLNGHLINIHPDNGVGSINIRVTFRNVGDDTLLWPTGVGAGQFISQGFIEIAGKPAQRMLFVCPTGQIQSIWYQNETESHIHRDNIEYGFIFQFSGVYCQEGYSLSGKVQHIGEMIIASLAVP
jgi:hypothetical protein